MEWLDWRGCYDDGWKSIISDASFGHPAKAARGLLQRIFAHMESQRWLPPRSRILDVFGGIGTTAIEGASRGHEVVCIELEERFCKFALENFAIHRRVWEQSGDPLPAMLHGDSRKAVELVMGHFAVCVGSPPFTDGSMGDSRKHGGMKTPIRNADKSPPRIAHFGQSAGQLGAMKEGDVDAVFTSPPYAETGVTGQGNFQSRKCPASQRAASVQAEGYGVDAGNLGALKEGDVDGVASSPPYEGSLDSSPNEKMTKCMREKRSYHQYTGSRENIGNQTGETFWLAARTIMEQVHLLLRSDGVAAFIVKDYVKQGKRVPFCDNWARLCEAVGFTVIQRVRCHLTKEEINPGLFGAVTRKTERKSFFRRLHERKPGAVRIDWEEVVFVMKQS